MGIALSPKRVPLDLVSFLNSLLLPLASSLDPFPPNGSSLVDRTGIVKRKLFETIHEPLMVGHVDDLTPTISGLSSVLLSLRRPPQTPRCSVHVHHPPYYYAVIPNDGRTTSSAAPSSVTPVLRRTSLIASPTRRTSYTSYEICAW